MKRLRRRTALEKKIEALRKDWLQLMNDSLPLLESPRLADFRERLLAVRELAKKQRKKQLRKAKAARKAKAENARERSKT